MQNNNNIDNGISFSLLHNQLKNICYLSSTQLFELLFNYFESLETDSNISQYLCLDKYYWIYNYDLFGINSYVCSHHTFFEYFA